MFVLYIYMSLALRLPATTARWEVDRYLSATGYLPEGTQPFFVALPKDRGGAESTGGGDASATFRAAVAAVDGEVSRHLRGSIEGGFDEDAFGAHVGFAALKSHLEVRRCRLNTSG